MSCFVPRSFYHPVAVLQAATKGRVGTPTLIYDFARGHLWGRQGFFQGLGRTNPSLSWSRPRCKGLTFLFLFNCCVTALWVNRWPFHWWEYLKYRLKGFRVPLGLCVASDTFDCSEVIAEHSSVDMTIKKTKKNFEIFNLVVEVFL